MKTVFVLLFICLFSCIVVANVTDLDTDNFHELVYKKDAYWLLEFYAPWCGHCKKLAPIYEDVGKKLKKSEIKVGKVNCDANTEICDVFGVRGYPNIKLVKNGQVFTFNQIRDVEHIITFAKTADTDPATPVDLLPVWNSAKQEEYTGPSYVIPLGFGNFSQISSNSNGWLVEFYSPANANCTEFDPVYRKLAFTLQSSKIGVGAVNCDVEKALCEEFFVTSLPTIIYTREGEYWVYTGENRASPILRFLKDYKSIGSRKLPGLYGNYHNEVRVVLAYFHVFEVFLKDYVWASLFGALLYGLILGWYIFRPTTTLQQQYYTNQQTKQQSPTTSQPTNSNKPTQKPTKQQNNTAVGSDSDEVEVKTKQKPANSNSNNQQKRKK